jgi:aspartyl-tRNA(Asn)/glutamyl-tRNA(Gln) amidotransferase subunit A
MLDEGLALASISEVAERVRRRELSATELLDVVHRRVDRFGELLNCFISLRWEEASREARAADDLLASGTHLGPLHGIPIALKDNIALGGERTTAGSPILADWLPGETAPVVERLRAAGAVVIGKCNLYEFAYGAPHPRFGPTRNPWKLEHSCAGSSSGSAAAVAAGLCYSALGTDTGASIRVPAAFCGVVGTKPTYGRCSIRGIVPVSVNLDHVGPLTRSVRDSALMLAAMTDPPTAPDVTADIDDGVAGLRVGMPRRQRAERIEPAVADAVRATGATLAREGATVVEVDLPDLRAAQTVMWAISAAEAAEYHRTYLRDHGNLFHPVVRSLLEAGEFIPASEYVHAQRVRASMIDELEAVFEVVDALLLPVVPFPAYEIGAREVAFDGIEEDVLRGFTRYTPLFNVTGHPALSLPCGLSDDGRPLAAQLVGRAYGEATLFRVARAYERATEWHLARPPLPDVPSAA